MMAAEFTTETRTAAYLQAHGCCEVCGLGLDEDGWQAHHRQKRRHGRADLANCLVICMTCHDWVHKHETEAALSGYIIPSHSDPSILPMKWADGTWRTPVGRKIVGWADE